MAKIHPTAIVDPGAVLGEDVEIGPYCIVGPHCRIGDGTRLRAHVTVMSHTTLGRECDVFPGAVLGGPPLDLKFQNEESFLEIGERTVLRECVTVHRATGEGNVTRVGDGCFIMPYSHITHNCTVGNEVIMANCVQLGGHVTVDDFAFLGGMGVVHQNCRVGKLAIISGASGTRQDIPPFSMSAGIPAEISGINKVGLKRRGFDLQARSRIWKAYQMLWYSDMNLTQAVAAVRAEYGNDPNIQHLLAFVESSKRGIRRPRRGGQVTISLEDPASHLEPVG